MILKLIAIQGVKPIKSFCQLSIQFRTLFFTCFIILLLSNLYGSYGLDIESIIPSYSKSYVVIRNIPDVWSALKSSPSWKTFLLNENVIIENQKLDNLRKLLNGSLEPGLEKLFLSAFVQQIAFVNTEIGFNVSKNPVIIVDTGTSENAPQMPQIADQILKNFHNYEIKANVGVYTKVPFGMAKHKEKDISFIYALIDNLFVAAPDQDSFETLVDVYSGKEPSILYDPKFNRTRAEVPENGDLFAYINMELFWLTDNQKPVEGIFLRMLGIHEIKSIALNIDLLKPNSDQDMYLYIGKGEGLLASISIEPDQMLSSHIIPASNADIFFAMNLGNPLAIWEIINNSLEGMADSGAAEFEKDTGLSLKNDVLSSLNGEIGFAVPLQKIMEFLDNSRSILEDEFLIFIGAKDPETLNMAMEKILASGDVPPQKMSYKDINLYSIPNMDDSEVPVGYMFAGDLLIFGNFKTFGRIIDGELPLAASERFANLSSRFPQNARMMYYMDMKHFSEILTTLPSDEKLENDLADHILSGPIGGTVTSDGEGLKIKSINDSGVGWLENMGYLAIFWALNLTFHD